MSIGTPGKLQIKEEAGDEAQDRINRTKHDVSAVCRCQGSKMAGL